MIALLILQAGCARETTRPDVTEVQLSAAVGPAVGSPSRPVTIDVLAANIGNVPLWRCDGCGCGNGIGVSVLGPDGAEVLLRDPNAVLPMCADGMVRLEPAGTVGSRVVFSGVLYTASPSNPAPTHPAPPGTYTVVATFGYMARVPGEFGKVSRRTTFDWQP